MSKLIDKTLNSTIGYISQAIYSEKYSKEKGLLQGIDCRVKLAAFLVLIISAVYASTIDMLLIFLLISSLLAISSRIPLSFYIPRVWLFVPLFTGIIAIPAVLNVVTPGTDVLSIANFNGWHISVTREGIHAASILVIRVAATSSFAILFTLTTRWNDAMEAMHSLKLPRVFILILSEGGQQLEAVFPHNRRTFHEILFVQREGIPVNACKRIRGRIYFKEKSPCRRGKHDFPLGVHNRTRASAYIRENLSGCGVSMVHPVIELEDVSYTYPDGTDALNRISIRIDEGESAAIAGPNGAGKSTLLLIMAGLVAPSSGEVRIFGRKIGKKDIGRAESMSDIRKRIGIVFQDADTQLFSATVYDDVAFGPMHLGIGEDEVDEMVKSTLEFLGITHLSERHPYDLSGGEKRKAAIATALVSSPDVLLLDEPTADLDPKNRREFVELLKKLKEDGKTIVIATHEMDILPEVVERMIVLNGEIVREGSIGEVMLDEKLLERANLDVPVVTRLFKLLKNSDDIPLTVEEAIGRIKEMVGDK